MGNVKLTREQLAKEESEALQRFEMTREHHFDAERRLTIARARLEAFDAGAASVPQPRPPATRGIGVETDERGESKGYAAVETVEVEIEDGLPIAADEPVLETPRPQPRRRKGFIDGPEEG